MSRKTVSMIGNLTRDMMSDVMETSLKKPIQTGEFRKNPVEPAWRCPAEYIYELVKTEQFVMEYLKPKQAVGALRRSLWLGFLNLMPLL